MFRIILLLAIAAGLALFTWSNLQPVAVIFLGVQLPALPLSWWILGGIVAGAATTIVIKTLFSLSTYARARQVRSQFGPARQRTGFSGFRRPAPSSNSTSTRAAQAKDDAVWNNWDGYETASDRATTSPSTPKPTGDDWDREFGEDWDDSPASASTPVDRKRAEVNPPRTDYEINQEPKSGSRSGSVYSYSYKDPENTGAGRQENVVDAEYRVIVPPYRTLDEDPLPSKPPPPPPSEENADDWFEDEPRK